jgi:uncharacterized protein
VFAVDTNILVYAHFERYPQHSKARAFCERLLSSADDWCMSWQIVYEYVRITTHPSIHTTPLTLNGALSDLEPYMSAERLHMLNHTAQHRPVLVAVSKMVPTARGNFIHDLHYAVLLHENGVSTIYTADSDFAKFPFLKVIDPTV